MEELNNIQTLEKKVEILLEIVIDNRDVFQKYEKEKSDLKIKNKSLEKDLKEIKEENMSLKMANSLFGSTKNSQIAKEKINLLIKELDSCIKRLSNLD